MTLIPTTEFSHRHTRGDLIQLQRALRATLAPLPQGLPGAPGHRRLLNLACGRADETGVLAGIFQPAGHALEIVGADLRAPEIDEARRRWRTPPGTGLSTAFHAGDGRAFLDALSGPDQFHVAVLRHQNYWNNRDEWEGMFDRTLHRLADDGLLVITSYFDLEHDLACRALRQLGARMASNYTNPNSRNLADAPGKSVDRHIAVFRKPSSA